MCLICLPDYFADAENSGFQGQLDRFIFDETFFGFLIFEFLVICNQLLDR